MQYTFALKVQIFARTFYPKLTLLVDEGLLSNPTTNWPKDPQIEILADLAQKVQIWYKKKVQNWHKKGADLTQKGANLTKSPQNGLQILPNFLTFPNLKWLIRPTPLRLFSSTQQIEFIMKNIWNEI